MAFILKSRSAVPAMKSWTAGNQLFHLTRFIPLRTEPIWQKPVQQCAETQDVDLQTAHQNGFCAVDARQTGHDPTLGISSTTYDRRQRMAHMAAAGIMRTEATGRFSVEQRTWRTSRYAKSSRAGQKPAAHQRQAVSPGPQHSRGRMRYTGHLPAATSSDSQIPRQ